MPRYKGSIGQARPADRPKVGVLLTNLGTPDAPTPGALRRYLREFLSDARVVELPRPLWWMVLNLFILPFRPLKVSKLYRSIWRPDGSPLLVLTQSLAAKVRARLGSDTPVVVGMRYGEPSITRAMDELVAQGCGRIVHLPLYPQYSASTTGTNLDAVSAAAAAFRWVPDLRHVASYHAHPAYIEALAESLRRARSGDDGKPRHLVMSFHGIPQRYADQGDPYPSYCQETAEALAEALGLRREE